MAGEQEIAALSPAALSAAMRGGTAGWGQHGSIDHVRYAEPIDPRSRRRCNCGCKTRATHRGMANGVCLMTGCELHARRWVKNPIGAIQSASRNRFHLLQEKQGA